MTTIVANRVCMAADSKVTEESTFYYTNKLRVIRGCIVGGAGATDAVNIFLDWFRDGGAEGAAPYVELPKDGEDDAGIIVLVLSTRGLFLYTSCCEPDPLDDEFYAVGTGKGPALAAMRMGATPRRAVEVAAEIDPNTGGRVRVITLDDVKNWKGQK
jgi:ATP-dependent protease HslVU (ClpYQ) peptidase subunit